MEERTRYQTESCLIHGRMHSESWEYDHHLVPPITRSTTFRLDSTTRGAQGFAEYAHAEGPDHHIFIYDRLREPNKDMLEERLAVAARGEMAVSFASGMAAISAALGVLLKAGEEMIVHRTVYGCTHSLITRWLPRLGISHRALNLNDTAALFDAIRPNTRVVFFETPANPTMELVDIAQVVAQVAAVNAEREPAAQIKVVVDNTFATPYCQRPLELGVDVVVHSLTKGLSGFGTDMGGVVVGPMALRDALLGYRKDFGGVLAPQAAWSIQTYGLPSLAVRMQQAQASAQAIASFLERHEAVARVCYPGLPSFEGYALAQRQMRDYDGRFAPGSMLYFELVGDTPHERQQHGIRLINWLAERAYTITLAVSLGNVRTLVEHPSSMTHAPIPAEVQERMGLSAAGIRLSIGLEATADLTADLSEALAQTVEALV